MKNLHYLLSIECFCFSSHFRFRPRIVSGNNTNSWAMESRAASPSNEYLFSMKLILPGTPKRPLGPETWTTSRNSVKRKITLNYIWAKLKSLNINIRKEIEIKHWKKVQIRYVSNFVANRKFNFGDDFALWFFHQNFCTNAFLHFY